MERDLSCGPFCDDCVRSNPNYPFLAAGFDLGRSCEDGRAMALRAGDAVELLPDETEPTRVVRWLDRTHLVVAAVRAPLLSPPGLPTGGEVETPPGAA